MLKRKPWCWLILLALFTSSALAEDVTFIEKGPDQITDEPITLKVFASVKPNVEDMATNLQTLWYEEATGVHIEWEVPSSADFSTKLNLSLASGDYPEWAFRSNSPLRMAACQIYQQLWGQPMSVATIHAGTECSIFASRIP